MDYEKQPDEVKVKFLEMIADYYEGNEPEYCTLPADLFSDGFCGVFPSIEAWEKSYSLNGIDDGLAVTVAWLSLIKEYFVHEGQFYCFCWV